MQPIDLIPDNFRSISSLITQEQQKLIRTGMTPGFARFKALEAVAPLIRPPTSAQELASWIGKQGRQFQLDQNHTAPSEPANNGNGASTWQQEMVWNEDQPDPQHARGNRGQTITHQLKEALETLKPGQARSTIFPTKVEARRCQSILSQVVTHLGWREKGSQSIGYKTTISETPDGCWKIKVTRL